MVAATSTVTAQVKPPRLRVASRRSASDRGVLDHDMLVGAVASRLRALVDRPPPAPEALQEAVRDCAQALELLRPALVRERGCGERLEREVLELRRSLAAARLELAGSRDGERHALHITEHDALTALPNGSFHARLEEALVHLAETADGKADADSPALAVLFLVLDGFEPVVEQHGPQIGDELLRIVAQRLSRSLRGGDMVCRLGDHTFACLLYNPMGRQQLSHVAAKLFDVVSAPLSVGSLQLVVQPSIGIAMSPHDGDNAVALLEHADAATHRAKRRRLGYTFYDGHVDP